MSLSGAKSQNFFVTAILVSALTLCWSAEAKPPKGGSKPVITEAMREIELGIIRADDFGSVACYARNNNTDKEICAVFEYYNLNWWFGFPPHVTRVQRRFTAREIRLIDFGAWAPSIQRRGLRCKLLSASYIQRDPAGKDLFICPY